MNIGIVGVGKSLNIGDQLIAKSLGSSVERISNDTVSVLYYDFHDGEYDVDFSHDPIESELLSLNKEKNKKLYFPRFLKNVFINVSVNKIQSINKYLDKVDTVIIGGGHLLIDNYGDFIINLYLLLKCAKRKGKPVTVFSVGVGDKTTFIWKFLAKSVLTDIPIYTRDSNSSIKLEQIGIKTKGYVLDPAFSCIDINKHINNGNELIDTISLFIMDPYEMRRHSSHNTSREDAAIWWSSLIELLINKTSYSVVISNNGSVRDYQFIIDHVVKKIRSIDRSRVTIAPRCLSYVDLLELINSSKFIIAQRLHAVIPSIAFKKGFLALRWDTKLESILHDVNLEKQLISYETQVHVVVDKVLNFNEDTDYSNVQKKIPIYNDAIKSVLS